MAYKVLRREWRSKSAMYIMMFAELGATVAMLVLFGIAQPNLYRTKLWQAGYELGFNSSPAVILYAYANHVSQPNLPFVWSQTLTNFNVAISVISLFFLLTKLIAFILHVWYPVVALLFNVSLVAFYAASLGGQAGPDYLDPTKPSPVAWYIAKPCTVAANKAVQGNCTLAKGTFAATSVMFAVTLVNLGLNIWAMLPNEADKKDVDSDDDSYSSPSAMKRGAEWEMQGIPPTPRTATMPYTPRTMAFNTLERKMPLRREYG
ncbi:Uu.00g034520.m01.CDS01 [Anthostomella pinea]|uniref:Uu.00g034520.m01.CDS01 n=1 Tax=Anthostomella pinea TaxID=933095 RepID=A0AAI8V931_9PEZI|nr:Uu.00g034520.m01.CDS01 [Anthostomella pinea]